MRERDAYRDNLELIAEHFGGKKIISASEAGQFLGVPAAQLMRDERFRSLLFSYGRQKRISVTALARWMS